MKETLPVVGEPKIGSEALMWIVGPGEMESENTSLGIREPFFYGQCCAVTALDWRFPPEIELVGGGQFVETYGDLSSHYVRFSDPNGETLLRGYNPDPHSGAGTFRGGPTFRGGKATF